MEKTPVRTETGLTRRDFARIAAVVGAGAAISGSGLAYLREVGGEGPPNLSPYLDVSQAYQYGSEGFPPPILILTCDQGTASFGSYFGEILCAEGSNCFEIKTWNQTDFPNLQPYQAVILTEGLVNRSLIPILHMYVEQGGTLIAMRPSTDLATLFGMKREPISFNDGYLQIDPKNNMGLADYSQDLIFHGPADVYLLDGSEPIAWIYDSPGNNRHPGIARQRIGQGWAILWAFDLARTIALTRQGNPDLANAPDLRWDGNRAINMFVDWIDLEKIHIPHADEMQRLFFDLLLLSLEHRQPLPRLWYFPEAVDSVLVATGDSHINSADSLDDMYNLIARFKGHMSVYYSPLIVGTLGRATRRSRTWLTDHSPVFHQYLKDNFEAPTPEQICSWRDAGHEFTLHPYVESGLEEGWSTYWHEFTGRDYGPVSETVRTHRILWTGWVETAKVQASYGIKLNLDFYHWGPLFQDQASTWQFGYMTGSGLPMRFVDERGRIIDNYQLLTELADDHMLSLHWGGVAELPVEQAINISTHILHEAASRYPSAITAQFHVDPLHIGGSSAETEIEYVEGVLSEASRRSMPIMSAQEWLEFTQFRRAVNFREIRWQEIDRRLVVHIESDPRRSLRVPLLLPSKHGELEFRSVEVNGIEHPTTLRAVGQRKYRSISIPAGFQAVVAQYA